MGTSASNSYINTGFDKWLSYQTITIKSLFAASKTAGHFYRTNRLCKQVKSVSFFQSNGEGNKPVIQVHLDTGEYDVWRYLPTGNDGEKNHHAWQRTTHADCSINGEAFSLIENEVAVTN
jgi:hypothetical protein